jgi:hypothetical protein
MNTDEHGLATATSRRNNSVENGAGALPKIEMNRPASVMNSGMFRKEFHSEMNFSSVSIRVHP